MNYDSAALLLKSRNTQDRIRAVTQIGRGDFADPEREPLLLQALRDRSPYVAALAAELLGQGASKAACAEMADRFLKLAEKGVALDPGCHVRSKLAYAFAKLEYPPAIEALRVGIRTTQIEAVGGVPFDTGAQLRANCALALADMGVSGILTDIVLLLFDMSGHAIAGNRFDTDMSASERRKAASVKVEPRKAAAQALAILGDPNGLLPLTIKLTHPGEEAPEVLQECMQSAAVMAGENAVEMLVPYLEHPDQGLAGFAALMIARTRSPEAASLIKQVVERLNGQALQAVALSLTTLRTDEAEEAMLELSRHNREDVRLAMLGAWSDAGSDAVRKRIAEMASSDRSQTVRSVAGRALR